MFSSRVNDLTPFDSSFSGVEISVEQFTGGYNAEKHAASGSRHNRRFLELISDVRPEAKYQID